jgi:predicted NodU family carbamoyl transferase
LYLSFGHRGSTDYPPLVNASFNVASEPIVASPVDALFSLGTSGTDALVLEEARSARSCIRLCELA